jgi:TetR/AcrR family transcriptional regulator
LHLTIWLNYMDKNVKTDKSTEEKILAAARQVFMEKGPDGARMQDIADKAEINKALLHYYFRSKDKLFEVIFLEEAGKFMPRIAEMMASDLPLFEKIERFVTGYIDVLIVNPLMPLFILSAINKNPQELMKKVLGNKRPPLDKVEESIAKEVKKGTIKPIAGVQLMLNMISMCIFPFLAKPMVQWVTKMNDAQYMQLMEQRKKEVIKFISDSIRK